MFTHIRVGSSDVARSRAFYDAALGALGVEPGMEMNDTIFYRGQPASFAVGAPREGEASHANGGTIGFVASDQAAVDAFHAGGLAYGGSCEGPPGLRQWGANSAYGAYLRDPDGNKICAFYRSG
jgi:catechol 2,3-dioxygenase-like lactoylglutathione lyase family enzyme